MLNRGPKLLSWLGRLRKLIKVRAYSPGKEIKVLGRVVIDLTPALRDCAGGSFNEILMDLIWRLGRLAVGCDFVLLTSDANHCAFAEFETANIHRVCLGQLAATVVEADSGALRNLNADLLFCPLASAFYLDPPVPAVCVIHDLQHLYYPQFFDSVEKERRERNLVHSIRAASRLVCVSDFVRSALMERTKALPEQLKTIHATLSKTSAALSISLRESTLQRFELEIETYLFYPASFWPHKNHELLLTAFGIYRAANSESPLKLVLAGLPGSRREFLKEAATRMGLSGVVLFTESLQEEELSVLLHSCRALIYPSLFEEFTTALTNAMAAGRPVLCSNTTGMPEAAGGAALLFDPRVPVEMAGAIAQIENPALNRELAARGRLRLMESGVPDEMASRYLDLFRDLLRQVETPR